MKLLNIRSFSSIKFWVFRVIVFNSFLNLFSTMSNQPLNWPSCRVSQSANSVSLNLLRNFLSLKPKPQPAAYQSPQSPRSPPSAFPLYRPTSSSPPCKACTTRSSHASQLNHNTYLIKFRKPQNGVNNIGLFIHNDNSGGSQPASHVSQRVEVHPKITQIPLTKRYRKFSSAKAAPKPRPE